MQQSLFVKLRDKYGVRNLANLVARGHTHADLYSCELHGKKLALKIGDDARSRREVTDNLYGYRQLTKIGAKSIIPRNLEMLTLGATKIIVMEFLQHNFKREAEKRNPRICVQLTSSSRSLATLTLGMKKGIQAKAIREIKYNLRSSYGKLADSGVISKSDTKIIGDIREGSLVSDRCCIFMLDFTPDNVFLKGSSMTVIDPWKQTTYMGSFIPSLSMFASQLFDVYKLGNKKANYGYFESAMDYIGAKLRLKERQIEKQMYLGQSLQYALSSHALISSNRTVARRYSRISLDMLSKAI